ncbi:MAG: thioredoxin fold domain-containing protein [Phycisphaerae bacterium]
MKKLMIATIVAAMAVPCQAADWEKTFVKTFAEAQKAAKAGDKLMYLHFTTTWCGWCRKIEKDVYASDEGAKLLEPFACATLDCTVQGGKPAGEAKINIDLMKKYHVSGYPSLVIVDADGVVMHSWSGYVPLDAFGKELDKATATRKDYKEFVAYAEKADKKGYEYNAKAMDVYSRVQMWDKAGDAAAQVRKLDEKNAKGDAARAAYVVYQAATATDAGDDKVKAAVDDIRKFDPANEKGYLQEALWAQAMALAQDNKLKEASAVLADLTSKAAKLENPERVWVVAGQLQVANGDNKAALESAKKALDADSRTQRTLAMVGQLQAKAGDPKAAADSLQKALDLDPNSQMAPAIKQMLQQVKKTIPASSPAAEKASD